MDSTSSASQLTQGMKSPIDDSARATNNRPRSVELRPNSILGNFESVDKIVVYAFGAFDRYYICWRDKTGAFQQERHGLPRDLDEWLFPPSGGTRDLATLQVSLGHHDEFFAFDKDERISHKNTEFRENASNIRDRSNSPDYRISRMVPEQRRKSHTFSHSDPTEESRTESMRRGSPPRKLRPRSIAVVGAMSMKSWHDRKQSLDNQLRKLDATGTSPPRYLNSSQPPPPRHYAYSDASVQTDMVKDEDIAIAISLHNLTGGRSTPDLRRAQRSNVSSISSLNSLLSDDSAVTNITNSSYSSTSSTFSRNPICMGVMQRYFRESQYRLGDALTRPPSVSVSPV